MSNEETNNLILAVFCPLELRDLHDNAIIWSQPSPNAPKTQRPVLLQTGKESTESIQSLSIFNNDIAQAGEEGFVVNVPSSEEAVNVKAKIVSYMLDRKAANLYLGLGGAYCDLCHLSKEDCLDEEVISNGVDITRDIDSLHNVFNELVGEDGSIRKSTNDYDIRAGQTKRTIATNQVVSTQVLHALMRSTDMFLKTVVHVLAAVFEWSESKSSWNNQFLEAAKVHLQQKILGQTGIRWDYADPTGHGRSAITGNICWGLLHDHKVRNVITEDIPESYRHRMEYLVRGFQLS